MSKRKSNSQKFKEGRCQGIGPDYVPFYKSNENGRRSTGYMIPDRIEGRQIHCLSDTEAMMYYLLRWNPYVEHIREQFLLDHDRVNDVRLQAGYREVSPEIVYTTDFLVDFTDDHQEAYSVKYSRDEFNPESERYQGREYAYAKLIERQNTERLYWESLNVGFNIVTRDDLMKNRILIKNIAFVLGYQNEMLITNREQKFLYLVAHHYINIPMDMEFINTSKMVEGAPFDIDRVYQEAIDLKNQLIK